jgi:hypothetical protein
MDPSNPTITWAVVTYPPRAAMAAEIAAQLGPETRVFVDHDKDLRENHRRAWRELSAGEGSDWVGVMQDDVILCDDFVAKAQRRAAEADARGFRAISLYNTYGAIAVRAVDARWARAVQAPPSCRLVGSDGRTSIHSAIPGELCVLVRRTIAAQYQAWLQEYHAYADLFRAHDAVFGVFLNATISGAVSPYGIRENHVYIAIPNLVDHRIDVPSSIGGRGGPRRSTTFRRNAE